MNTLLNSILPNKKPRRSSRLESKEKVEYKITCRSQTQKLEVDTSDTGRSYFCQCRPKTSARVDNPVFAYFEALPIDVKFQVFSYLTVPEMSILTITSKAVRNTVVLYMGTAMGQKIIQPHTVSHADPPPLDDHPMYIDQFINLGLLWKRSTCLYATRDRLRFIEELFQRHLCFVNKSCLDPLSCVALLSCGKYFHTMIAGWDEKECCKAFDAVCNVTSMSRHLNTIVRHRHGNYPGLEIHVRLFFRRVFINPCKTNNDQAFWLGLILRNFPMVHQARALFLLFGPLCEDMVQWEEMCETTPATEDQAVQYFGDLARAFRVLHEYCDGWNEDDIISVMEELTSSPDEWLAENVANLLYLCGESITMKVLSTKAINGRMTELAGLITSLSLVCIRYDHTLNRVLQLITNLCAVFDKPKEKQVFLNSIVDTFSDVILELHEYGINDDDLSQDLTYMVEAQAQFTKELVLLAFKEQGVASTKPKLALRKRGREE